MPQVARELVGRLRDRRKTENEQRSAATIFVDLKEGTWWAGMRINALGQALRFLVFIQRVGHRDLGVLAVTVSAGVLDRSGQPEAGEPRRAFEPTARDSVTLVHTNAADQRWPDVAELIDRTLSTGLKFFVDAL